MTGKKHHSLFGTVNTDNLAPLKIIAQRKLAAFPLQETDWQQCAQELLEKLTSDIETQQGTDIRNKETLANIELTKTPFAALLCQDVMTDKCKSNEPGHPQSCEEAGEKLSAVILVATLILHGNSKNTHAIREALDSARLLRSRHPDLLMQLAPFLDESALVLTNGLSELASNETLLEPQKRLFIRMATLLRKASKASLPTKHTDDTRADLKRSDADRHSSEIFDSKVIITPTSKIDPSPFPHRLEDDSNINEIEGLSKSMENDGQDVPIIVRPHPEVSDRYQLVSGTRRLMAARGMAETCIKGIVKDLNDIDLLMEQGRENSYRREATYIEKVRLAGHIFKMIPNYEHAKSQVMSALSVDKTEASRLKVIGEKIPDDIIESIGPAPRIGRPRWKDLADLLVQPEHLDNAREIIEGKSFKDIASSDERISHLIKEIEAKPALPPSDVVTLDNTKLATLTHKDKRSVMQMPDQSFAIFVSKKLPELYETFKKEPEWNDAEGIAHAKAS
ncbi:plasmid partitioning protein RepB [Cohaesibacter sp. CAU 1516]|uniref:plasmid partitioning protein RepB n=1 Tax=Cohaesibacter sp. CAU 1516 TaxID=2576038 RepID=UPI0010FF0304|nr:plasmid partitioning protein RepB [Cohaesibacter sp. CAU 1516]TLP44104.1 plasmid partitioning protein RepB [Cohaesibacter sp. CAU 1516]